MTQSAGRVASGTRGFGENMNQVASFGLVGCVQGLAEFLPISSSGHIELAKHFLGTAAFGPEESQVAMDVFFHLGSLVAVLFIMRREIIAMLTGRYRLILLLAVATVPAGIAYTTAKGAIEGLFANNVPAVLVGLLVTGVVLVIAERFAVGHRAMDELSVWDALIIGIAQAIALPPGISRSGMTLTGGFVTGLSREAAARFAFLLAIPAIGGASLVKLRHPAEVFAGIPPAALAAGFLASAVTSYVGLKFLLRVVVGGKLWAFGVYCFCVVMIVGALYVGGS